MASTAGKGSKDIQKLDVVGQLLHGCLGRQSRISTSTGQVRLKVCPASQKEFNLFGSYKKLYVT